jgi:thiol-disulfide isomerase/thioredoxin
MKTLSILLLSVCAVAISPAADKAPKPPRGAFTPETYAEAKAKATTEKKLIVYMWSEMNSSCPKCQAGTESALKAFKTKYVIVFGHGSDTSHAPESLRQPLSDTVAKVGNLIPVVMIVDPASEKARIWKKIQKEAETAGGGDGK